jgi:hypothetical protein
MNNKIPITRLSKFFSQDDFDLQIQLGKEYLHGDINMKLVLYRVDREKSDINNIYGEVGKDEIQFLPPVEFNALVKIEEPKNSSYKNGLIRYNESGNIVVSVYISHLEELNIDIRYGDYIGYADTEDKVKFYQVTNDGRITSDNKHKMFGYKPHYRTITCAIVQEGEFRGV